MGGVSDPIEFNYAVELCFIMLFNRFGAELMGMYFKVTTIPLRCEVDFIMLFNRVGVEAMGMYFKSIRMQVRC